MASPRSAAELQTLVNQIAKANLTTRPRSGPLQNFPGSSDLTASNLATQSETYIQDVLRKTGGWVH